jgi:hypothetical protein
MPMPEISTCFIRFPLPGFTGAHSSFAVFARTRYNDPAEMNEAASAVSRLADGRGLVVRQRKCKGNATFEFS